MNGNMNGDITFEEIEIPVPWGFVAGKWWGSKDQQPILAVHGWQDNAGTFDTLAPLLLKDGHSLLCIDLPGHGLSSHYPEGLYYYIFWDGLLTVRRVVKHFNWEKVTLLGHSLGGAVSFMYAGTFPNEIDRFISIDIISPSVRDPAKIVAMTGPAIDRYLKYENLTKDSVPCYEFEEMINIVYDAHKGSITKESAKILMKRGMSLAPGSTDKYLFSRDPRLKVAALGFISMDNVLEIASNIRCKVLNIRGKPGMTFDNPENYQIVLDKIKSSAELLEYHEVEGTHHLHLNDPNSIYKFISDFLNV